MADLDELRAQTQALFQANSFESSAFLGSKLVALQGGKVPGDVYLLARIHLANGKPLSALQVLEQFRLASLTAHERYLDFCLLVSQSNFALGRMDDVLKATEPVFAMGLGLNASVAMADQEDSLLMSHSGGRAGEDFVADLLDKYGGERARQVLALLCLERGKAFELLDNRAKSMHWLKHSLLFDCRVMESLERMCSLRLSFREEQALMHELDRAKCFQHSGWLRPVFASLLHVSKPAEVDEDGASRDADSLAIRAEAKYLERDPKSALQLTSLVFKDALGSVVPPTNARCALVHIASMVELGKVSDLFYFAHKLVAELPKQALSWYAVGAYYYSAKKFDLSRRFFSKASQLDPGMLEAFVGSAHAHAMNEESDRAITIYRAAARLFPNSSAPLLGTAMEYLRTNNPALAQQFCEVARNLCEVDPAVYNELGVISYRTGEFADACVWFHEALGRISHLGHSFSSVTLETVTFNYAHALRRAGNVTEAIVQFKAALKLCPKSSAGHAALGLTFHLNHQPDRAIESYHIALGLKPNDTLVTELMELALVDLYR